jgi:hypothetical protein
VSPTRRDGSFYSDALKNSTIAALDSVLALALAVGNSPPLKP